MSSAGVIAALAVIGVACLVAVEFERDPLASLIGTCAGLACLAAAVLEWMRT